MLTFRAVWLCAYDLNQQVAVTMLVKVLVRILASFALGVSGGVLCGYAIDLEVLYTWYGSTAMAVPTAVALIAVGTGLLLLTFSK